MYLIVIVLMCLIAYAGTGEEVDLNRPRFRIIAPQYVCDVNVTQNVNKSTNDQVTSIRLQPVGGEALCYVWHIYPRVLNPPASQWFNLNVWRSARLVEKTISEMKDSIASTNIVRINNSQLLPGVSYEFKVTAFPESCSVDSLGDERSFTIVATGSKLQFSGTGSGRMQEGVSIILAGADFTYADQPYILEAQVTFCEVIEDYQFKWKLSGPSGDITLNSLHGKTLKLPPNYFKPGMIYKAICDVEKSENGGVIAQAQVDIKILKRKWQMQLNFKEILVTVNQVVSVIATLFYSANDNVEYTWKCRNIQLNSECTEFKSKNSNIVTVAFDTGGRYQLSARAVASKSFAEKSCLIIVTKEPIPEINIDALKSAYAEIPAGDAVSISASTAGLRPGCEVKWKTVKAEALAYFDESSIPGGIGNISVLSLEGNFLLELSEFGNETVEREIPLEIPRKSNDWHGVAGDSQYRLRLHAKCQCVPDIEICDKNRVEGINSYVDVLLETNAPPEIFEVTITPAKGTAFSTKFTLATPAARDKFEDYPLQYTFSLKIKRNIFAIGSYFENTMVETFLPYSAIPIIAECKVCDARGACASRASDPVLVDLPSQFTEKDLVKLETKCKAMMRRQDYDNLILMIYGSLEMFKEMDSPGFYKRTVETTLSIIRDQIEQYKKGEISYDEEVIRTYVNKARYLMEIMNQHPEDIVQNLLQLYNNYILARKRRRRSIIPYGDRTISEEDVNTALDLIEQIIYQSQNKHSVRMEESKLPGLTLRFLSKLCRRDSKYKFDRKITSFAIETISLSKKYNIFLPVPFYNESATHFNKNFTAFVKFGKYFSDLDKICVGKIAFPKNYYVEENIDTSLRKGLIYGVFLIDQNKNVINKTDEKDVNITFRIPISHIALNKNEELNCCVLKEDDCSEKICTTEKSKLMDKQIQYVQCTCRSLGFYSLVIKRIRNDVDTSSDKTTVTLRPTTTTLKVTSSVSVTEAINNVVTANIPTTIGTRTETFVTVTEISSTITQNADKEEVVEASSSKTIIIVVAALLICFLIITTIWCKRKKHESAVHGTFIESTENEIFAETNLCLIDPNRRESDILSYRNLYDENLLDGSASTLEEYNKYFRKSSPMMDNHF